MPVRECRDANAEIAELPDQPDELLGVGQPLGMSEPFAVRVAWWIAAHSQHVVHPGRRIPADHVAQFGDRVIHGRQVRHRGQGGLLRDAPGGADGAVPARSARPVGHRHERGIQRFQLPHRPPEDALLVVTAGWEELHRERRLLGVQPIHHRRHEDQHKSNRLRSGVIPVTGSAPDGPGRWHLPSSRRMEACPQQIRPSRQPAARMP